jgi:uncharacterized protein involved in outer membrane biogenesis
MRPLRKILIWFLIIVVSLCVVVFVAASVYINRFTPQLEKALTENIGLQTKIDGSISLKVLPGLSFVAKKVRVISNETYVLRVAKAEISIDIGQLLSGEVSVSELHFVNPKVFIIRNVAGFYNYEELFAQANKQPKVATTERFQINLNKFSITGGSILYLDQAQGDTLSAEGIEVFSEDLGFTGTLDNIKLNQLHFNGLLNIRQFTINELTLDSLSFAVNGRGGKLKISDNRKEVFGGTVSGNAIIDFNTRPVSVSLEHTAENMDSQLLLRSVESDEYLKGKMNYELKLDFQSFDWQKAMVSAQGYFKVSGNNLVFYGVNLDKVLNDFNDTQDFNVMNFTAIFLAGPYGAAFANGLDFSHLLSAYDGEQTEVNQLIADWKIIDGKAICRDVAFSTNKYRIAASGKLDMVNKDYENFTIAMVNKSGCAGFSQTLSGNFRKPVTKSLMVKGIVFGKTEDMWKVLSLPSRTKCEPIYTGSVKHPEN